MTKGISDDLLWVASVVYERNYRHPVLTNNAFHLLAFLAQRGIRHRVVHASPAIIHEQLGMPPGDFQRALKELKKSGIILHRPETGKLALNDVVHAGIIPKSERKSDLDWALAMASKMDDGRENAFALLAFLIPQGLLWRKTTVNDVIDVQNAIQGNCDSLLKDMEKARIIEYEMRECKADMTDHPDHPYGRNCICEIELFHEDAYNRRCREKMAEERMREKES